MRQWRARLEPSSVSSYARFLGFMHVCVLRASRVGTLLGCFSLQS